VTFYKWAGKLLKRKGKFAVAKSCCCEQWYCVLTQGGDYECRDAKPDPNENAQVLSEHKTEKECQKECYERYYCIDDNGDYRCVKESDLPDDADIISGPQRLEECEAKCENCPPCGDKACEAAAAGDDTIIEDCCFNLADEEQWTFNGTDWELTQRCGKDERTPCKGRPVPSFPQGLNAGDVFTLSCVPDGRTPEDNPDCGKCLYDCDKDTEPKSCVRAADTGKYTEKECKKECEGLWYCTSAMSCDQQSPPLNPAKEGFEYLADCLTAAKTDCCQHYCDPTNNPASQCKSAGLTCDRPDCNPEQDFYLCIDYTLPGDPNNGSLTAIIKTLGYDVVVDDASTSPQGCCDCGGKNHFTILGCCKDSINKDKSKSRTALKKAGAPCDSCTTLGDGIEEDTDEFGNPVWRVYLCEPPQDGVIWVCLDSGGCRECYNDEAPGVPPNPTDKPNCSSLPPHSGNYGTEALCNSSCNKDVVCWVCVSGGICLPQTFNTPGGVCPQNAYPTPDLCNPSCGGNPLP
jgi:hypothetical protein